MVIDFQSPGELPAGRAGRWKLPHSA